MNILVLVDFSSPSVKAIQYAFEKGNTLNAQIYLLHVISKNKSFESEIKKSDYISELEEKMIALGRAYPNQQENVALPLKAVVNLVRIGEMEETISSVCKSHQIDLIVLGTRNKHNPVEYLLGSVSTKLIQKVPCPLIIVPEKTEMGAIRNIAIATDDEFIHPPLVKFVRRFSEKLKANVKQVHVFPLPRDFSDKKEEVYNPTWTEDEIDPKAEIVIVRDPVVVRGLDYFIEKHEVDLLALYVPDRKGWQKYFHISLSKRMVYHSPIPILTWNDVPKIK